MNIGKISEAILKRSVLKQIERNHEYLLQGADIGMDCALLNMGESDKEETIVSVATASVSEERGEDIIAHGIIRACNNLAAGGSIPKAVQIHIMMPERMREIALKRMMAKANDSANRLGIQISGGQTEVLMDLQKAVVSVTALGLKQKVTEKRELHAGQELILTKWIAASSTALIAKEKEEELLKRYPAFFIKSAQDLEQYYSVLEEAAIGMKENVIVMHDLAGTGIYGALWELGERYHLGMDVFLKKIPIKQETVEICEFFNLNPYELRSDGSLLMVSDNGEALISKLKEAGIAATCIGYITDSQDRVVINDDEKRFLELPRKEQHLGEILRER